MQMTAAVAAAGDGRRCLRLIPAMQLRSSRRRRRRRGHSTAGV